MTLEQVKQRLLAVETLLEEIPKQDDMELEALLADAVRSSEEARECIYRMEKVKEGKLV